MSTISTVIMWHSLSRCRRLTSRDRRTKNPRVPAFSHPMGPNKELSLGFKVENESHDGDEERTVTHEKS